MERLKYYLLLTVLASCCLPLYSQVEIEASEIRDSIGLDSSTHIKSLLEYAWRQFNSDQIQEACNTIKDVAEDMYNGNESYLGYLYYSYAHFLGKADEKEMAEEYALKAKSFFEDKQKYDDDYYLNTLTDLALLNISNQDLAIGYLNKVKTAIEEKNGKSTIDYLDVLLNIAYVYRYNNQLAEALDYAKQAKDVGERIKDIDYGSYLYTLDFLAGRYSSVKQYNDAIKYAEECLTLMKEAKDFGLENRLPTLDSLIIYYGKTLDLEKVHLYAKEAYLIRKSLNSGVYREDLAKNISFLLYSNYYLHKFEDCEANVNEIKELYGTEISTKYDHYYEDMNLLANSYFYRHLYNEAIVTLDEIENNYRNQYGEDNDYIADLLLYKANIYLSANNIWDYHDYSQKGLELKKKVLGEFNKDYLKSLSQCANDYYRAKFINESYDMFKQSALIAKKVYGTIHPQFVINFLSTMIFWRGEVIPELDNYDLNDLTSFFRFIKVVQEINEDNDGAEGVMSKYKQFLLPSLPQVLRKYKNEPSSAKALYDCFLLLKMNHTDYKVIASQVLYDLSADNQYILYNLYNANKNYVNNQIDADKEVLDILYNQIKSLKDELIKLSPTFSNYYSIRTVTSDALRNEMPENSVIIDYIPLKQLSDSFSDYIVTIDKKINDPQFISVYNAKEQIEQIAKQYGSVYFFVDSDTILSNHGIDFNSSNYYVGYEKNLDLILNNNKKTLYVQKDPSGSKDDMILSIIEFGNGVDMYNKKQYQLAIDAFLRSDSLMYFAKGRESNFFGHGMQWISSCYYKMGQDSIAKQYSDYYNLPPIDLRLTVVSDSILDIATSLYDHGKKREALEKFVEASKVEKSNLGIYSYWYANTLSHCAVICNEIEEYERAIEYETEALIIREKSLGMGHIDYYYSLDNMFKSYIGMGNIKDLLGHGEKLINYMEEHKNVIGRQFFFYTHYTSTLARLFAINDDSKKALLYCNKALKTIESLIDIPEYYTKSYYDIIFALNKIGEDRLTFELCKKMESYYDSNQNKQLDQDDYSSILILLSNHYYELEDFFTASIYMERALSKAEDNNSFNYGMALSNLSLSYVEIGRMEEAIELSKQAVNLCDTTKDFSVYADRLLNLSHCYSKANRPKDAFRINKACYDLLKDKFGNDNYQTMFAANNLAAHYAELGYNDDAKKLLFQIVEYAGKNIDKNGEILASAYNNIAMLYAVKENDFDTSLKYNSKAYEIRKNILGENNLYTIESLYNKGRTLLYLDEISEAVAIINKALDQTKGLVGERNLRFIEKSRILPYIYAKAGDFDRAKKIGEDRFSLIKETVDQTHGLYLGALEDLSELYFYANDTMKLRKTIIDASTNYRKMINSDFPNYTSIERANVVSNMERFFDWLFPLVCYYKKQPFLCSELYNALLLRKGILLNSEIEFSRLIKESGDTALVQRFNKLISNRNLLNKQYQLPIEQRVFDTDSLKQIINEEEDHLVIASKEYGDYTRQFKTNWKDIKENLNDDELSIEFVVFDDTCTILNRIYYALVIDKSLESPELIPLCRETDITDVQNNGKVSEEYYSLIWEPILHNRRTIKTIFFSPSGLLNNIGIEYVDINGQENISDKFDIYRLSSTREIIDRKESLCRTAALYGGLNYAVDTEVLLAQNTRSGIDVSPSVMYRGLSDSLSVRNSFDPLYNTKAEISEIGKTLKNGKVDVSIYCDTYGTEESFKALSGKGVNLIHLATHGMYIGASEAESKKEETNLSFIQLDENNSNHIQEDESLSRSFLVMSGGDMLPSHKEVPDNLEDGILTALEISKLDLRGLDLVVLSACQTALGDVDNEGVYGLQRGFKKAGANTILMSLDKVDDEATKVLMVDFYNNLMSGKSKHQSLKDAQKHLRQVNNGKFDRPEYWASFIMLDGLN